MSRRLRYLPRPMVVEVTCRTVHGRFLLHPSAKLNRLAIGVLARAQHRYEVRIHAFCLMSNHYHLLLTARDALQLARFMNFVQSNLAREAGRLVRWRERFWGRRYQAILVSDEPTAQLARLRYILAQGCKEGLVIRPELWRGAHCVRELMNGQTDLHGEWIDRTALYRARPGTRSRVTEFTSVETLRLTPLPCFDGMTSDARRDWVLDCIDQLSSEARASAMLRGSRARATHERTPRRAPSDIQPLRRTRAPWFHVASALSALELRVGYFEFLARYRSAAEKLKRGIEVIFPCGSFPPAKPYVELTEG